MYETYDQASSFENLVPIFIAIIFFIVIGTLIFRALGGLHQWSVNEQSPRHTATATITSKRLEVSAVQQHHDSHMAGNSITTYYITFEFQDKERKEFKVKGKQYGLLSENDTGTLTYQGTRFIEFERETEQSAEHF